MQEFARRIAKVSIESKLSFDEEEYVSSFKVELMDAVMQWCRGASFSDILKVCCCPYFKFLELMFASADRPVRGKRNSSVPTAGRATASNGTSSQSYWEPGA